MRSLTLGKLTRRLGVVLITIGLAFSLAPRSASAAGWSYTSVPVTGTYAWAADSVRFGGSTYTAYASDSNGTWYPWRIMRHAANGQSAASVALPSACTGYTGAPNGISTMVAYGQIHVFAQYYNQPYICHAWSEDGVNYGFEYLAGGLSWSQGISTAVWGNQLHIVGRGADGGVRHTWYDPVGGGWISEKLDDAGTADDMSSYAESAIGIYNGQFHVVYVTNAGIIRDKWWDSYEGWHTTTNFGGYILSSTDSAGLDVETTYGGQFHIVYRATDGNMKHAWYDPSGNKWRDDTMTVSGAPLAVTATRVKVLLYNGQWHTLYATQGVNSVGHIWWDPYAGRWMWERLDINGSAPTYALDAVSYSGQLDIYATNAADFSLRRLHFG